MLPVIKLFHDRPTCIFQDFNEDILLKTGGTIFQMFSELGYTQHMMMPTRDSGILIDHIYPHNIEGKIQCDV